MSLAKQKNQLAANLNVSVILPFYKKLLVFTNTLQKNAVFFQRNGIEVIVVMDEPSEQEAVLALIRQFPLINWKLIVNDRPHAWRNPAKAINVGIRHAVKEYVLVMGPDSEMTQDLILDMLMMSRYYVNSFFVGQVAFVSDDYDVDAAGGGSLKTLYYGSILVAKRFLLAIRGYDESFEQWGGDDDNLRARLQQHGLRKIKIPGCLLLHREDELALVTTRKEKTREINRNNKQLRKSFNPSVDAVNVQGWGHDFDKVVYDWSAPVHCADFFNSYLRSQRFADVYIKTGALTERYKVLALLPTHNESGHMPEVLQHLEKHCDGIILLDDASDDDTYEKASSDKLLLKIKKERRTEFDDLGNRNILLDLAFFFKSDFYFFTDADERFDERYADLRGIAESTGDDTFCFHLVHLWDDAEKYRTDVPEKSLIGQAGVLQRWRMFRNIGRMNIQGNKLHFVATPYKAKRVLSPVLIRHYGMIDEKIRSLKYARYQREDDKLNEAPNKYQYFLDEHVITADVSEIKLPKG